MLRKMVSQIEPYDCVLLLLLLTTHFLRTFH